MHDASTNTGLGSARLRRAAHPWVGEDLCEIEGSSPRFLWVYGSTFVEACPQEDGSFDVVAWVVLDPQRDARTDELFAHLSETLELGHLVIDEDGDVALEHRIPPEADARRLEHELREVCRQADRIDDILSERLRGVRSLDRLGFEIDALFGAEEA